jgi:hypothetical protein
MEPNKDSYEICFSERGEYADQLKVCNMLGKNNLPCSHYFLRINNNPAHNKVKQQNYIYLIYRGFTTISITVFSLIVSAFILFTLHS